MAFQIRSVATLRFANLVTSCTPGRLFQISTSRLLSGPIRSASCSSVEKTPAPVSCAAFLEAWTVMWFFVSIVKVFIIVLLGAALFAVITSITLKCLKSKALLLLIDDGEEPAMALVSARDWQDLASNRT